MRTLLILSLTLFGSCKKESEPAAWGNQEPSETKSNKSAAARVQPVTKAPKKPAPAPNKAEPRPKPPTEDARLKAEYDALIARLDGEKIRTDYAAVARKFERDATAKIEAVKTLGESGELAAIPWLIRAIDDNDRGVSSWATASLGKLVSSWALKRRDRSIPTSVVIKPLPSGEIDLAPLRWLVGKRLRERGEKSVGHWASMAGYLGLHELRPT